MCTSYTVDVHVVLLDFVSTLEGSSFSCDISPMAFLLVVVFKAFLLIFFNFCKFSLVQVLDAESNFMEAAVSLWEWEDGSSQEKWGLYLWHYLQSRIKFCWEISFCQLSKMASPGLRKMLILIIFQHLMVYECGCVLQIYGHFDVGLPQPWQMLCHCVIKADGMPLADVIAIW